jgi:aspartyl-tRNA(Asn)/glutamyl-tRNA(Gln) amidotransferase subunit B
MEDGSLRCDLNVSVAPINLDDEEDHDDENNDDIVSRAGQRVEVKNLNSLRQVQQAAEYEAKRQAMMIHDEGQPTSQETRTFDVKSGTTLVLRTKEGAKDYRFMPEPDLPPLILNEDVFGEGMDLSTYLRDRLPELPEHARERLVDEYDLSPYLAGVLTADPPAIKMFEEAVNAAISQLESSCDGIDDRWKREIPETVANLLCNELYGLVREHETQRLIVEGIDGGEASVRFSKVTATQLGEVAALNQEGNISNTMAKQLLKILYSEEEEGASPRLVALDRGIKLITNVDDLERVCQIVIDENPDEVEKYKLGGKFATKMTKFFLGKAMSACRGNAHPERLIEVLDEMLQELAPPSDES